MLRPTYSFILGNKVVQDTANKVMLPVINKYTGEVATRVALANRQDIDEALRQGVEAEGAMKALKPFERRAVLEKLHAGLLERKEEIVRGIVVEAGKPVALANAEFSRGLDTIQEGATAAGDWSERGTYNSLQTRANGVGYRHILTRRFPLGLLSFVTPFNFPLNLVLHKVCPAVAAGCPFVLKPSDRTPVTSLVVGEILAPLLPPGSVSVLPSSLEDAPMFSQDERIKCLSFTGSPKIGWMLKSNAGKKRVALELGGNAAVVVDNDVDSSEEGLQRLAERIGFGAFAYGGQTCISVQRVIVHVDILPRLREKLVAVAQSFNAAMGDPSETSTKLGPLISQDEACRVERWVGQSLTSSSSSSSPKVLVGGSRKGASYEATIVENVDNTSPLWKAEIFGPVCVLQSFHKFEDAIALVNDSDFGLQAGIYTRDINKAFYAYEKLDVGGVLINDIPSARTDAQPYGGIKDSGVGREGVVYAMEEFSELKSLILKDIGASL